MKKLSCLLRNIIRLQVSQWVINESHHCKEPPYLIHLPVNVVLQYDGLFSVQRKLWGACRMFLN